MRPLRRLLVLAMVVGASAGLVPTSPAAAVIPAPNFIFAPSGTGNGQTHGPTAVATAPSGDIYVADRLNNRVQQFTSAGVFVRKWGTFGTANGQFNAPQGIVVDPSGNVYVADGGNNRIQKFSATGSHLLTFGASTLSSPAGLAFRGVTLFVADSTNDVIRRFNGTSGALLGTFGSPGTGNGQFDNPRDLDVDSTGNLYVLDQNNNRIQKLNSAGTFQAKVGTAGSGNGQFSAPRGLTVVEGSPRRVLVADTQNNRIQEFSDTLVFQSKLGTLGTAVGQFDGPRGIAVDALGNVFVAESDNNRMQRLGFFAAPPPFNRQWAVPDDGAADIVDPTGITTDARGNVYVVDEPHIHVFSPDGTLVRNITIPQTSGYIAQQVAVDSSGNVYLSQTAPVSNDPDLIDKYNPQGQLVDLIGEDQGLGDVRGVAVSPVTGNIFVAAVGSDRVAEFTAAGAFVRNIGTPGSGNGQHDGPCDLVVDAAGTLYVGELVQDRIQAFGPTGTFLRAWPAAVGACGLSLDRDGRVITISEPGATGIAASLFTANGAPVADIGTSGTGNGQFQDAEDVAADARGNIYITDRTADRVQRFAVPGAINGTVTGPGGAVANLFVVALDAGSGTFVRGVFTNASGQYSIPVPPSRYIVGFVDLSGTHPIRWHNNRSDIGSVTDVDHVTVNAGGSATANASLPASGVPPPANPATLQGTVTADGGGGLPGIVVMASDFSSGRIKGTITSNSGAYTISGAHPSSGYRVAFIDPTTNRLFEWHDNQPANEIADATPITLTANVTSTLNAALADNPAF